MMLDLDTIAFRQGHHYNSCDEWTSGGEVSFFGAPTLQLIFTQLEITEMYF